LLLLVLWSLPALAAERVASFGFELVNTSLEPTRPDETQRVDALDQGLREAFSSRGYDLVDMAPVAQARSQIASLRDCVPCALDLAKQLGAELAVQGWVQKVSNLILNLNIELHEVATGKLVRAGSVDIRGNTDDSWAHGLRWLVAHRLFPPDTAPG
jgi:hypothetical protein